jgi:predicted O-linked N-acetylglucosamine transferase (SPINDLY family)
VPPQVLLRQAQALSDRGEPLEARRICEALLRRSQGHAEAWHLLGVLDYGDRDLRNAARHIGRALRLSGGANAAHHANLGLVEMASGDHAAALSSFRRALRLAPDHAAAQFNLAVLQERMGELDAALAGFERALGLDPDLPFGPGAWLQAKLAACDWTDLPALSARIAQGVRAGDLVAEPHVLLRITADEALLKRCARTYSAARFPPATRPTGRRLPRSGDRIRLGYLSGEFRAHATSALLAQVWSLHDRNAFELIAFDNGWDDGSPMRRRVEAAFDAIVPVAHLSDADAAQCIAERDLDLLIDLNGAFGAHRLGVLARRPAPLQVSYLGYPGTLGAPYLDYLVADAAVLPAEHMPHYDEKVVRLPHAYQPNDTFRVTPIQTPTRCEVGLPADRFVFCCFNQAFKITPRIFQIWMSVLTEVTDSVLWLLDTHSTARANLRAAAARRGIEPDRLIFAPWAAPVDHLARLGCADLFLDTVPYNAHTTASDALWMGLPVLTRRGGAFAGRVASSLLTVAGLPELVCEILEDYEARAIQLARSPDLLRQIRETLIRTRGTSPLFDTATYTRHLEAAFRQMHARCRDGLPPDHFDVAI